MPQQILQKLGQDSPRKAEDGPKMAQDGPRWAQYGPTMAQDGSKDAPTVALETAKVGGFRKQAFRFDKTQVLKILIEIGRKESRGKVAPGQPKMAPR